MSTEHREHMVVGTYERRISADWIGLTAIAVKILPLVSLRQSDSLKRWNRKWEEKKGIFRNQILVQEKSVVKQFPDLPFLKHCLKDPTDDATIASNLVRFIFICHEYDYTSRVIPVVSIVGSPSELVLEGFHSNVITTQFSEKW